MNLIKVSDDLYRGSRPKSIEDIKFLKAAGIKTVMDLQSRPDKEVTAWCLENEMWPLEFNLSQIFPPSKQTMYVAYGILCDEDLFPIFVHCRAGVDRTGMVIAFWKIMGGMHRVSAIKDMYANGMHWWLRWWSWFL